MKIVVDEMYDGNANIISYQVLHTDRTAGNKVTHPTDATKMIDVMDFLAIVNGDPTLQAAAGYHDVTQLLTDEAPRRKWDRIVSACNNPIAPAEEKALGLKP